MKVHEMTTATSTPPPAMPPEPGTILVRPWEDPVLDRHGHDPRSRYCERFWLPLLGPSAVLLVRQLADHLDANPGGFALPAEDAARSLGLGAPSGKRSAFHRTVARLAQFRMVHHEGQDVLLARRRLPSLTRTQVLRLPQPLQEAHAAWRACEHAAPALPMYRERARTLALTLLQLGEAPAEVVAHLARLRVEPALTREALAWAVTNHRPEPPTAMGAGRTVRSGQRPPLPGSTSDGRQQDRTVRSAPTTSSGVEVGR